MSAREKKELPSQDYQKIRLMVLSKADEMGFVDDNDLYVDLSFPPDKSSLTYVYTGDDRYEKMIFKRPKNIAHDATFVGVGGLYLTPFPWRSWKKSAWFQAAIAVVSFNVKFMEKLIKGYKHHEQSMQRGYIGAFNFNLWRFGEWVDAVVDDHLPTLNNKLMYCPTGGVPVEFWAPLVEKAYAKCKRTYEAIECGKTLDALTDLTGNICEYFSPDVNTPENLFHMLYKSCINRSMLVCWRNDKRLTRTGFFSRFPDLHNESSDDCDSERYLHLITATTKFPLTDGRLVEMVRLKCAFTAEPDWNGKFSNGDQISWESLNLEFLGRYRPLISKDPNEYWMTLEDFRCNFGGLIICSSPVPFEIDAIDIERSFHKDTEHEPRCSHGQLFFGKGKTEEALPKQRHSVSSENSFTSKKPSKLGSNLHRTRKYRHNGAKRMSGSTPSDPQGSPQSLEIKVEERNTTVKIDSTCHYIPREKRVVSKIPRIKETPASVKQVSKGKKSINKEQSGARTEDYSFSNKNVAIQILTDNNPKRTLFDISTDYDGCRSGSIQSNTSLLSDCKSTFSASDITLQVQDFSLSRENSIVRPRSAPMGNPHKRYSSGSLPNMTINNFLIKSHDRFRSHGAWQQILQYHGKWEKNSILTSRMDMKNHARNSRILLSIFRPDAINELIAPNLKGKGHLLISLLQDYRLGSSTANNLLVPIGFCVYKCKNRDRDEKRSFSKLTLVDEVGPKEDTREVNGRFDLEPGNYFIVPYCLSEFHEGEYLVRVLGEKDPVAGKTSCLLS